jgi:hypothetical protein
MCGDPHEVSNIQRIETPPEVSTLAPARSAGVKRIEAEENSLLLRLILAENVKCQQISNTKLAQV